MFGLHSLCLLQRVSRIHFRTYSVQRLRVPEGVASITQVHADVVQAANNLNVFLVSFTNVTYKISHDHNVEVVLTVCTESNLFYLHSTN